MLLSLSLSLSSLLSVQHVRADQATFRAEIEAAGFTFVEELAIEGMTENYCMVFRT